MSRITWNKSDINQVTGFVQSDVSNYYGGAAVWKDDGRCFMGIENWDGWHGEAISAEFYAAFVAEWSA